MLTFGSKFISELLVVVYQAGVIFKSMLSVILLSEQS